MDLFQVSLATLVLAIRRSATNHYAARWGRIQDSIRRFNQGTTAVQPETPLETILPRHWPLRHDGTQLTGVIVGNGVPLCMCSAFGRSDGRKGNICLYIDGTGQGDVWWSVRLDDIFASDYRIGSKAMLSCV